MALNLGPAAFEAIQRMKNSPDWRAFVAALEDQVTTLMNRAIEAPIPDRCDAAGYARGLRDIVLHIELVEKPNQPRNSRPVIKARDTALNV